MKKNLLTTLLLCLLTQWSIAQAPKWVDKAKRAVFSVITYDQGDKILNTGNGFFVTEDGVALSDYGLFKGAQRAVIINYEGVQMPVETILGANDMQKSDQLVIEALAFIRGRSLSDTYCIIDEAQNLTPHEIKTIITRAGEGTKMIFTGDIQQIDQPYLDSQSNGLVYMPL